MLENHAARVNLASGLRTFDHGSRSSPTGQSRLAHARTCRLVHELCVRLARGLTRWLHFMRRSTPPPHVRLHPLHVTLRVLNNPARIVSGEREEELSAVRKQLQHQFSKRGHRQISASQATRKIARMLFLYRRTTSVYEHACGSVS